MTDGPRQRLDKWLFFARVVKSRSLAARLVQDGKVRVNRVKVDQPAHSVKVGDVLTISLERRILVMEVRAPGVRRGPATEARLLYEDRTAAAPAPAAAEAPAAQREKGSGRPEKKERRQLEKWRSGE